MLFPSCADLIVVFPNQVECRVDLTVSQTMVQLSLVPSRIWPLQWSGKHGRAFEALHGEEAEREAAQRKMVGLIGANHTTEAALTSRAKRLR